MVVVVQPIVVHIVAVPPLAVALIPSRAARRRVAGIRRPGRRRGMRRRGAGPRRTFVTAAAGSLGRVAVAVGNIVVVPLVQGQSRHGAVAVVCTVLAQGAE